jgi:cyclohexadienyl dehydratase
MQAGDFGIVMSGVTVRPDRAVSMRFTRPYAVTGSVAIIRRSDSHTFRTPDDLDRPTVHIAVNRGGHLEQVGRRRFPHAQIHTVERNADLPGLLRRGEVGAVISEQFEAQGWVADDLALIGPFTRDIKAYALPAEAVELRRRVDEWLAAREADGWLNAQRRRWLGERAVRTAPEACFDALAAAIDLRLQLMPLVAAVKRRDGLPIEDAAQEARVREHVRSEATAVGLRPSEVVELFRIQIEAAKAVERVAPAETVPSDMMLADLRAAITAVSDQVIAELVRCEPWLSDSRRREQLGATLRTGVTTSGSEPFVGRLVAFLVVGTHRP